jgi:peptide/nickel transport system ATP-binding protein
MTAGPLVKVENLGRAFDISRPWLDRIIGRLPHQLLTAVAGVSFTIDRQETFALVGESGSGKSTLAKMAVGLLSPTTGEVVIDGVSMSDPDQSAERRRLRRRIQMVFQDPYASLEPRWHARNIIAEPIRAFGLATTRTETTARVEELLNHVGLASTDGRKYPHEFSGGERQRIAIARALASEPDFIVCDEPTSALDVSVQAQILNLMSDLQDQFGLTYLFISHNLAVVRHIASRIGVMYLGRLVEIAPTSELFRQPRHPYTRMLFDALPDLEMTGRQRMPVKGDVSNPIALARGCAFHPRCPFAADRCRSERPRLRLAGPALVACHAVEERRL